MRVHEVMKFAPRYLSLRYGSLNSYVWEKLFPPEYRSKLLRYKNDETKKERIEWMKSLADEASLLAFIFVTKKIFSEGAQAAKDAVDIFAKLDVNEFYLGTTCFSGRNENVILGDMLAEKLMVTLGNDARKLIEDKNYLFEITDVYEGIRDRKYAQ